MAKLLYVFAVVAVTALVVHGNVPMFQCFIEEVIEYPVECTGQLERFSVDAMYSYNYLASSSPITRVDFEVQANSDVHIGLSAGPQDEPDMYEIVIGGWGNTQSVIRRSKQGVNEVVASTPGYLSPNEFRGFWISYDYSCGVIKVGRESFLEAFMEWTDPNPLPVNYIGYSTWTSSTGEFEFCVPTPAECTELLEQFSTSTLYIYNYLASTTTITQKHFRVQANSDVHIALPAGPRDEPNMYEIVIGGWGNTQSVIRRSKQGVNQVVVSTPGILSPNEFKGFWVTHDYNSGVIKVGREFHAAFMQWTDPNPLPVNYFGYSTGDGSTGEFEFCVPTPEECNDLQQFQTGMGFGYVYLPSSSPITYVEFDVKAPKDFYIALSPGPQNAPNLYEFILSGWGNIQTALRRSIGGPLDVVVDTPGYLSPTEFRGFWVSYDHNSGDIKFGREFHEASLEWTDPIPLAVNNIGYSSGHGKTGDFQYCFD